MKMFNETRSLAARGWDGSKFGLLLLSGLAPTVALAGEDGNGTLILVQFLVYALVGGLVTKVIKWRKDDARERAYEESLEDGDEGEDDERTADEEDEDEAYENVRWHSRRRRDARRRTPWRTFKLVVLLLSLTFLALLAVGFIAMWLERP